MIYKQNVKKTRKKKDENFRELKCKCGSDSIKLEYVDSEEWLHISCKTCGKTLFYNGA